MNEEEKELINNIERALNLSEVKGDLVTIIYNYIVKATINLINKLQKELEDTRKVEIEVIKENTLFGDKIDEQARLISKLQKELEQEKEKNKKLNLENQALFESINCNDDNMLARKYQKLQKELDKKDKVIDKMAELLCSIDVWNKEQIQEYFYKKVEEENE